MCLELRPGAHPGKERGFALVAALFTVVFLALFGILAARYLATTGISSGEDYLWAQALYAAEASAHRRILYHDGGGGGAFVAPVVESVTTSVVIDTFSAAGAPATLATEGTVPGMNIIRRIEVKYIL